MTPQPVIAETKYLTGHWTRGRLTTRIVEMKIIWDERFTVIVRNEEPLSNAAECGEGEAERLGAMADASERLAARIVALPQLLAEVEGLRAFKAAVDAAINSGDGSYRP
jgi:hypothetical protein